MSAVDVGTIWQIAGVGIIVAVIHGLFKAAGRDELAWVTVLGGVSVVLVLVLRLISGLFSTVRTMFQL